MESVTPEPQPRLRRQTSPLCNLRPGPGAGHDEPRKRDMQPRVTCAELPARPPTSPPPAPTGEGVTLPPRVCLWAVPGGLSAGTLETPEVW